MGWLRAVVDLKNNQPSTEPMFFGFQNWTEVLEYVREHEDEQLTSFVNLVVARGEKQLMWALNRTVEEDQCDVSISTAHKAKGCEWNNVRLLDDFPSFFVPTLAGERYRPQRSAFVCRGDTGAARA